MKEIIAKFRQGDPLTDAELNALITHYKALTKHLEPHGDIFRLVWLKCYQDLQTLDGYYVARNKN
jgi:hypothetical protein